MNSNNIISMFRGFSFPVEFDHVKIGTTVPFGTYTFSHPNMSADNKTYIKGTQYTLRLFMARLDAEIFQEVEEALDELDIPWTSDEPIFIEDSQIIEVDYNFGIVEGSQEDEGTNDQQPG